MASTMDQQPVLFQKYFPQFQRLLIGQLMIPELVTMMPETTDQYWFSVTSSFSQSASYCQNAANPSPTISGTTGGLFICFSWIEH